MTKLAQLFLTSIARRTLLLVISGFGLELFYRKLPGAVGHQLCQSLGDRQPEAGAAEPERDRLSRKVFIQGFRQEFFLCRR